MLLTFPRVGALYDTQINRISSHFCQIGHINSCSEAIDNEEEVETQDMPNLMAFWNL
jgi:hypothetical protein